MRRLNPRHLAAAVALSLLSAPTLSGAVWAADNEVMAADRAFSALSVEKGAALAFWTFTALNGRVYGMSGAPKIGPGTKAPLPEKDKAVLSWEPTAGAVSGDGQLGWTDGAWRLTAKKGVRTGHYLTVWVKEDGRWKVQADMGTTDTAKKP